MKSQWKRTAKNGEIVWRRGHLVVHQVVAGSWAARFDGVALKPWYPTSSRARAVLDNMPSRAKFWGEVSEELSALCNKRPLNVITDDLTKVAERGAGK